MISEKEQIPHFIPKINEVNIPSIDEEIELSVGITYLIEQKVFGGKSIDFIIVESYYDEQIIYAFQASILKEKLFTEENIEKILIELSDYLKNFIKNLKVRKENLYFGYVFSLVNENKKEFKSMIKSCNDNNIPYSYYSVRKKQFLNKEKKPIHSIYEIVNNPFGFKPISSIKKDFLGMKRTDSVILEPNFEMKNEIKNEIIKILKEVYNRNIKEIDFQECLNKQFIYNYNYDFFYAQYSEENSILLINKFEKYIIYNIGEGKIINDIYSFLNDKCSFDCYFIQFEGEEKREPLYTKRKEEQKN